VNSLTSSLFAHITMSFLWKRLILAAWRAHTHLYIDPPPPLLSFSSSSILHPPSTQFSITHHGPELYVLAALATSDCLLPLFFCRLFSIWYPRYGIRTPTSIQRRFDSFSPGTYSVSYKERRSWIRTCEATKRNTI